MRCTWLTLALVGCTPIYDAQYNDRADELDELRTEFKPDENDNKLISSGGSRIYWVDQVAPQNLLFLHSMVPGDPSTDVKYEWSSGKNDLDEYHFGEQLVAECSFGTSIAYEVNNPATTGEISRTSRGADGCAIDGRTVYFLVGAKALRKWEPPAEIPDLDGDNNGDTFIDFEVDSGIVGSIAGFSVIGNLALVAEQDGDLYTVDLVTKQSKWLRNDQPFVGSVFFDERGALYETQSGPRYIEFTDAEDPPDTSFDDMVRDGGYHLNFKHGDIQQPAGNGEFVIHKRHIIYRGQRGIFAYGLDTHNVVDLLLDRGEGIDLEIAYHQPAVTTGDQMFVFGTDSFGIGGGGALYQVDLADRLR